MGWYIGKCRHNVVIEGHSVYIKMESNYIYKLRINIIHVSSILTGKIIEYINQVYRAKVKKLRGANMGRKDEDS